MRTDTTALSADQSLILGTAARRPGRVVVPRPAGLRARGAVRRRLLGALLERGLVEEVASRDEGLAWRCDERGRHRALRLTPAGLAAAAGPEAGPVAKAAKGTASRPAAGRSSPAATGGDAAPERTGAAATQQPRPGGKLGRVLDALGGAGGATLAEMAELTGWQPHTTRAALTRLRRRGHALERLDLDGRKAYLLGGAAR